MTKLQVTLDMTEAELLAKLAAAELRDPRDQIRFVLRQEFERRGLLPATVKPEQTTEVSNHIAERPN